MSKLCCINKNNEGAKKKPRDLAFKNFKSKINNLFIDVYVCTVVLLLKSPPITLRRPRAEMKWSQMMVLQLGTCTHTKPSVVRFSSVAGSPLRAGRPGWQEQKGREHRHTSKIIKQRLMRSWVRQKTLWAAGLNLFHQPGAREGGANARKKCMFMFCPSVLPPPPPFQGVCHQSSRERWKEWEGAAR